MKPLVEWTSEELRSDLDGWLPLAKEQIDELLRREREATLNRCAVICDAVAELYGEDGQAAEICAGTLRRIK